MGTLDTKLSEYVWENFILFESTFSEKVYKNLLQFRTKKDKTTFDNTLEAIIELDDGLLPKIKEKYKPINEMSIAEIVDVLESNSYKDFQDRVKYIDRALYFTNSHKEKDKYYIRLRTYLSSYYIDINDNEKAFLYGKESFDMSNKILKDNNPIKIASYSNFSRFYELKGEYKKALSLYNQALEMAKECYAEDNSTIASLYNNIALLHEKMGNFKESLSLYEISSRITKNIFGDNHPSVAIKYANLGQLYSSVKDYEKALVYYKKALSIQEETLGTTHINTVKSYGNIGLIYQYMKHYEEALFFLEKSLELSINIYGDNHSEVATNYNNLGLVYEGVGEYNRAKEYYEKSILITKNIYGDNHIQVASIYNNLGHIFHLLGEYKKSETFYLKSIKIREQVLGKIHLDVAESYNNLGGLYASWKNYRKAEKFYLRALRVKRCFFDKEDVAMADIYDNLGVFYIKKEKYNEALKFLTKALTIKENQLGEENLDTLSSYSNLAFLYGDKGDYKNAELFFNKVSNIKEKIFGIEESRTIESYIHLVEFYWVFREYEKSIYFFNKSLKIIEEMLLRSNHSLWQELKERLLESEDNLKKYIEITYIEAIKIKNYFSIKNMKIDNLKGKKEIYFVGENGEGKTILLQSIALALKGNDYLKSNYIDDETKNIMSLETIDDKFSLNYMSNKNVTNLFAYGINRNKIHYEDFDKKGYSGLFDTSDFRATTFLKDPRKVLESKHPLILEFIRKLNSDILINNLKVETNPLLFKEKEHYVDFNKLSEGYKSTIIWLCDLVSRLIENQPDVTKLKELKGIVLIDEVDLYLHPKWKYSLIHSIREVFESIQFIMTTHSLVTILGASEDAVFYKVYKEDGETKITGQIDDISYYTSNILLTSPIFSLDSMKARGFRKDERLSSDDYIYREIHTAIREHMKNNPSAMDDELKQKVKAELKERLARLRKK